MNEDRWLVPAFSTEIAPPERARHECPFFVDGAWTLKPDYRGQMLYRADTGENAEILTAGLAPADVGLTTKPRPSDQCVWNGDDWVIAPAIVAEQKRAAAMKEFEALLADARAVNAGKADAYAAGLLSPAQVALFKAWANYQLDLVRVIESADFPDNVTWPSLPDADAIAAEVEAAARAESASDAPTDASET